MGRSGQPSYECPHLQAVKRAQQFVNEFSISEGKLEEMVDMNWISPKRAEECIENLQKIESRGICAVEPLQDNSCSRLHLSYNSVINGWRLSERNVLVVKHMKPIILDMNYVCWLAQSSL